MKYEKLLKNKMSEESYNKLIALKNDKLFDFIGKFTEHCEPETVYVCDDSQKDADFVRQNSLNKGEEKKLAIENQTVHYDGYND